VIGFLGEIFFAPVMAMLAVALIISIVGIPLLVMLPFVGVAFVFLWVAGYTAVAGVLGARLRGVDWYAHGLRPMDVIVGSILISGLSLFGHFLFLGGSWVSPIAFLVRGTGWFIEYAAWTIGLGAALAAWRRNSGFDNSPAHPPLPPPIPSPAPSAL
jgi:hypothetical protein